MDSVKSLNSIQFNQIQFKILPKMSLTHGEPLKVINFANSTLEFDRAALESLLLHPQVKDRKVVVLSIVGAFRKGKSFFLDYCLRFLYANVSSVDSFECCW
jgi:atlastin